MLYRTFSLGSAGSQFAEGYPTKWGINSFFGRVNYGFKDKYLFEANIRTDGSSRFAKGHKLGCFPVFLCCMAYFGRSL